MVTEHQVNKRAAWLLYRQANSLLAFIEMVEREGRQHEYPNFDICKAECQAAIAEAELPIEGSIESQQILHQSPMQTLDFMDAINIGCVQAGLSNTIGNIVAYVLFVNGADECKEVMTAVDAITDQWAKDGKMADVTIEQSPHDKPDNKIRVMPENYWRDVWHENCEINGRQRAMPMLHLKDRLTIEDGSELRLYECTNCHARVFAGLDANRFVVTREAPPKDNLT